MNQKARAASSSLNRKEDRFMFKPPTHGNINAPTPKIHHDSNDHRENLASEITSKIKKEFESGSKIKRSSFQRVNKVNKLPSGKRDINLLSNKNRSSS